MGTICAEKLLFDTSDCPRILNISTIKVINDVENHNMGKLTPNGGAFWKLITVRNANTVGKLRAFLDKLLKNIIYTSLVK